MIYLTKSKPLCCPKPDQTIHFFADSALERAFGVGGILQNVGPCSSFLNEIKVPPPPALHYLIFKNDETR